MTKTAVFLRLASPADLPAMAAIDPKFVNEPGRASAAVELVGLGESWVAEADGAVVGYALVSRHFFARPFVDLLVVAEDQRRRGIGLALMTACEASHGDDRMFTSTNESNLPMRALLAGAGWQVRSGTGVREVQVSMIADSSRP
jgi:GNAT superfamily N-acetyltransferase